MTNISPEEVATRVEALRRASSRFDPLDCEAALQVADMLEALAADDRVAKLVDAANQARLAFAGFVSVQSAVDKLDAALAAWEAGE